jgi:hypothetical protein
LPRAYLAVLSNHNDYRVAPVPEQKSFPAIESGAKLFLPLCTVRMKSGSWKSMCLLVTAMIPLCNNQSSIQKFFDGGSHIKKPRNPKASCWKIRAE